MRAVAVKSVSLCSFFIFCRYPYPFTFFLISFMWCSPIYVWYTNLPKSFILHLHCERDRNPQLFWILQQTVTAMRERESVCVYVCVTFKKKSWSMSVLLLFHLFGWLARWLAGWLARQLADWLVRCGICCSLTGRLADWLVGCFCVSDICLYFAWQLCLVIFLFKAYIIFCLESDHPCSSKLLNCIWSPPSGEISMKETIWRSRDQQFTIIISGGTLSTR